MALKLNYRPELDGLRTIAVFAVLFYHLDHAWIPGGFVGVDVFFVLSGFLITGVIKKDYAKGTFSFPEFYKKRIRRLIPALLFLVSVFFGISLFMFSPGALVRTARSVLVQPIAMQNMFFLFDGEYFTNANQKLFLHTWSLGIEEQFYLTWPLLFLLLSRYIPRHRELVLGVILLASFALNLLLMPISPKASFFLIFSRAWELGLGCFLFLLHAKYGRLRQRHWTGDALYVGGWIALFLAFFTIDGGLHYPGTNALLPALGTVGILQGFQSGGAWTRAPFSLRPMVWFGRLSYSLYLWHWPFIVFARRLDIEPVHLLPTLVITAISTLGAAISYYWVEEPIRRRRRLASDRVFFPALLAVIGTLVLTSITVIQTDGLAFRYQGEKRALLTAGFYTDGDDRCGHVFRVLHPRAAICPLGKQVPDEPQKRVLIWGNSLGAMWVGLFEELAEEYHSSSYLSARNCRVSQDNSFCRGAYYQQVLREIREHHITDVVLLSSWHGVYGIEDDVFEAGFRQGVEDLNALGVNVWLSVTVPIGDMFSISYQLERNPENPTFGTKSRAEHEIPRQKELKLFNELAARLDNVFILDPTEHYCDQDVCMSGKDNVAWHRDATHLTSAGARQARETYRVIFE